MAKPGARDVLKPDDEKSKAFRFRLHPQSEDEAEVKLFAEIEGRTNGRGSIRQYLIDLYRKAENLPEKGKPSPVIDTRKIMNKLDKVMSYLRGMKTSGVVSQGAMPEAEYDDDFLSSLDRMLDGGMAADADSDDVRYVDLED
jgi:hypothetical protein